jgi:hypothetical protein
MKKLISIIVILIGFQGFSQEHFSGISTSNRIGILNATINPAELPNLSKKFEVNIYGMSFNVSNNKVGFDEIVSGKNFEELLFTGNEAVNAKVDTEIIGPSFATKWLKWGFAVSTKAYAKFDIVDIDPNIGNAITNNTIPGITALNNSGNQRMNSTTYGEINLMIGRTLFENDKHKLNGGYTLKILFPGSYSNFGASNLTGTITTNGSGQAFLNNTNASLNIAYAGNLANSFTNFSDYGSSIFGNLNGAAIDLGINYQFKSGDKPKLNLGVSIRNIGKMTFKASNNSTTNYTLNIPSTVQGINLNDFQGIDNLQDVADVLQNSGYLTTVKSSKDFKVKLPTVLNLYADLQIVPKVHITAYVQQKTNSDSNNTQITAQNMYSVTPRVNLGFFEGYIPVSVSEISGTNAGIGFRLGGFYLGSGSIITALLNNSKQADFYTGVRVAFL